MQIGPKTTIQTTVTSYYVTVVFDLPRQSESRFTMYPNADSLIEYLLSSTNNIQLLLSNLAKGRIDDFRVCQPSRRRHALGSRTMCGMHPQQTSASRRYATTGRYMSPSKVPLPVGGSVSNLIQSSLVSNVSTHPNGISTIGSAVFVQLTFVANAQTLTQTHRQTTLCTTFIALGLIYRQPALWPNSPPPSAGLLIISSRTG